VIERLAPGGQAGTSARIENYPGFPQGISGAELASGAHDQARRFGAEILAGVEPTAGVFVAGDVRHGSVKRVASAVGEGAMAIALSHTYLKHRPISEACASRRTPARIPANSGSPAIRSPRPFRHLRRAAERMVASLGREFANAPQRTARRRS
jgi:hypothetical protein